MDYHGAADFLTFHTPPTYPHTLGLPSEHWILQQDARRVVAGCMESHATDCTIEAQIGPPSRILYDSLAHQAGNHCIHLDIPLCPLLLSPPALEGRPIHRSEPLLLVLLQQPSLPSHCRLLVPLSSLQLFPGETSSRPCRTPPRLLRHCALPALPRGLRRTIGLAQRAARE